MNSRDRVLATLAGEPVDRRPVSLTTSLYGAALTSCPLQTYYTDPEAYVRGQVAVLETLAPDIVFAPFTLALEGAAFGSKVRFFTDHPPNITEPAANSATQALARPLPNPTSSQELRYIRDAVSGLRRTCGERAIVAAACTSPIDLPILMLGIGGWLEILLCEPSEADRLLERSIEHYARWANLLLAAGADVIVSPTASSNPLVVPRDCAENKSIPALRSALSAIEGPVFLHSAGMALQPSLPLLTGIPAVAGFVLGPGESFELARATVGEKYTLIGNLDGPALGGRDAASVEAECLDLLESFRDDPRIILGTSAADIPYQTPLSTLGAPRVAAEAFETHRKTAAGQPGKTVCVACSIFRTELDALRAAGELDLPVRYLDSMMHLYPKRLDRALSSVLEKGGQRGQATVLLWGDCHPHMNEHGALPHTRRVQGTNCLEILLGRERFRELLQKGAFFLLPEWVRRWREIFAQGLGLDREISGELLRELHTHFIYIDTGLVPAPIEILDEISAYFGLPWETVEVGLDGLREGLAKAQRDLEGER